MQQSSCQYSSKNSGASATGVISITSGSETDLLAAVATVGPVAVAVDANTNAFRVGLFAHIRLHCAAEKVKFSTSCKYYFIFCAGLVLPKWRVRLIKLLQHQAKPCHAGDRLWVIQ